MTTNDGRPAARPTSRAARRSIWLLGAVLLFGIAAGLMWYGEGRLSLDPPQHNVRFPRFASPAERARTKARRTLPERAPPPAVRSNLAGAPLPPSPPQMRDPLLKVLPPLSTGKFAVVVEANALRYSPIGERVLACLSQQEQEELSALRQRLGIDPLQDLDRIGVADDVILMSGNFERLRPEAMLGETGAVTSRKYGDHAVIVSRADGEGWVGALWNKELWLRADSAAELELMIDRLEGRAEDEGRPAIGEAQSYGEIYGHVSPEAISRMLGDAQPELRKLLEDAAQQIELHVDASSEDAGLVVSVSGPAAEKVEELAKSLGGALSLGRLKARADGDQDLADLLDLARVQPGEGDFTLELALPRTVLDRMLAECEKPSRRQ